MIPLQTMHETIQGLIDSHVHVGQFNSLYFSPAYVSKLMSDVGVSFYAVSSTSMCEENYQKVLDEIHELIELDGEKVLPVMWITPEGLKGNIAWFLESDIKWKCIKIHPELHPHDWAPAGTQFAEVIDIARELALPVLIHTGNKACCYCSNYEPMIDSNPDVNFILAHGRPLKSALEIVQKYDNAYADSAFMTTVDMQEFIRMNLSHKLLWGTDMCIPKHFFPNCNLTTYYKNKLSEFHDICTNENFEMITECNAKYLFV